MSDIYVGELQDENANTVYPHTEASVVFCSDGKNVQEKINNELLTGGKVLKTLEEVEANTNMENVAGATALKEVNNNLMFPDGTKFYPDIKNGISGYNTDPARGADTFHPFSQKKLLWSNPAPNAYFHPQTLQIDLSKYNAIIISVRRGYSDNYVESYQFIEVPSSFRLVGSINNTVRDLCIVDTSKVYFSSCSFAISSDDVKKYTIPLEIWGVNLYDK